MTTRDGLRYPRGSGLSIVEARELRVVVRDGALWVHRPEGEPTVVGSAATVTSARWLDPRQTRRLLERRYWSQLLLFWAEPLVRWSMERRLGGRSTPSEETHGGAVVIQAGEQVVLSFEVSSFVPWGGTSGEKRESSGAVDLVRSLGLVLEPAVESELPTRRRVRAARVEAQPEEEVRGNLCTFLTLVAGVLAFLSWPYGGSVAGVLLNLVALVVIAPVLVLLVRHRRQFEALVGSAPDPGERSVYRPPTTSIGGLDTHFQFGRDDVVLVDAGGYERWLPGPAVGGVASCVLGDGEITWRDSQGAVLLALPIDDVAPDPDSRERLTEACASAGIEVSADAFLPPVVPSYSLRHGDIEPGFWMSEWERGRIAMAMDVLVPLGGVIHLVGAAAAAYSFPPWGYLLLLGSVAWIGVRLWAGLRYRSWRRRVRRRGQAGPQGGMT